MTPDFARVLLVVSVVWAVAVAAKAFQVVRSGHQYTFSTWDGGMIRGGRTLDASGTKRKLVLSAAIAALCIISLAGGIAPVLGSRILLGLLVVSIINDYSGGDR